MVDWRNGTGELLTFQAEALVFMVSNWFVPHCEKHDDIYHLFFHDRYETSKSKSLLPIRASRHNQPEQIITTNQKKSALPTRASRHYQPEQVVTTNQSKSSLLTRANYHYQPEQVVTTNQSKSSLQTRANYHSTNQNKSSLPTRRPE